MAINQLKVPGKVFSGNDSYLKMKDIIESEAVKNVLLITDKGIEGAGILTPVLELLRDAGVHTEIFYHVQAEPTHNDVTQLVNEIGDTPARLYRCSRRRKCPGRSQIGERPKRSDLFNRKSVGNAGDSQKTSEIIIDPNNMRDGIRSNLQCNRRSS